MKPASDDVGPPKEKPGLPGSRAFEQYARPRRLPDSKPAEKGKTEQLQKRLETSQGLVKELQSGASTLKAHVQKLESLNAELASQNKQLVEKLAAAEAKITALESIYQVEPTRNDGQITEFRNVRKIIANKLDYFKTKREIVREDGSAKAQSMAGGAEIQPKVQIVVKPPPPPPVRNSPPPPPPPPPAPASAAKSPSALVELYHSITKRDGLKDRSASGNRSNKAHNSIVGELQNRSTHLLAIKADVETKRDFIEHLIEKVQNAAYADMEDVLTFVDCLDQELSTLADERAVLKHFNWPERKADALREATVEYRDLKRLEHEASSFEDDSSLPCEAGLKKIECLLDKMERSVQRLIKLRGTSMLSYRECKIPVDWMLDSGMVRKMKLASVKLAKMYIHRLSTEHEFLRHSERETVLCQGVRFAYRAHKFAGGLDPETMHTFEELKEQIQAHGK